MTQPRKVLVASSTTKALALKHALGLGPEWVAIGIGDALISTPADQVVVIGVDPARVPDDINRLRMRLVPGAQDNFLVI